MVGSLWRIILVQLCGGGPAPNICLYSLSASIINGGTNRQGKIYICIHHERYFENYHCWTLAWSSRWLSLWSCFTWGCRHWPDRSICQSSIYLQQDPHHKANLAKFIPSHWAMSKTTQIWQTEIQKPIGQNMSVLWGTFAAHLCPVVDVGGGFSKKNKNEGQN